MQSKGQIHLLGCSTAGVDGHWWNPIDGIGLLMRMIMYHGIPKMANDADPEEKWSANLAGSLSQRIRDVYVLASPESRFRCPG
jgi:hypothetical protein